MNNKSKNQHSVFTEEIQRQFCVIGGGLSGVCAAVTAARAGASVLLIQARPVLGGNASSEVRLWALGASAHMHSNNRWARESGVIGEILLENACRNPGGNPHFLDAIILEKVVAESRIRLLLNTVVHDLLMAGDRIKSVQAFNSLNETRYIVSADYFCDASGDGIVGAMAGESFHMGNEAPDLYNEPYAATARKMGPMMGHSIFFYTRDTGKPISFSPPAWAYKDIPQRIPRYRSFSTSQHGCAFWWIEYGGNLDTIRDTETIKWELWKIIYGVWDYIKNSGDHPDSTNQTIEWIGSIPGKRESRRFIGCSVLTQTDLIERRQHVDAVAYGGWSIDIHPSDGIYSADDPCVQFFARGVYQIRLSNMLPVKLRNLFYAGRIMSASHVVFASLRVMATLAHAAQALGEAVALCLKNGLPVQSLLEPDTVRILQQNLLLNNQFIPHIPYDASNNLIAKARITASSQFDFQLPENGTYAPLIHNTAIILPAPACGGLKFKLKYRCKEGARALTVRLMSSTDPAEYIPELLHDTAVAELRAGEGEAALSLRFKVERSGFAFLVFEADPGIELALTSVIPAAIQPLEQTNTQTAPPGSGFDSFDLWFSMRRPKYSLFALQLSWLEASGPKPFGVEHLLNGYHRPFIQENCWQASTTDRNPELRFSWDRPVSISKLIIFFDVDYEHALESVQREHFDRVMPQRIRDFDLVDEEGRLLHRTRNGYLEREIVEFDAPVTLRSFVMKIYQSPASLFAVYAFS